MSVFQNDLIEYYTGYFLRIATRDEIVASRRAAKNDGGVGVILLDSSGKILASDDRDAFAARRVYVVQ